MIKEIFEAQYPAEFYTSRPNPTALLSPLYDSTFKGIFSEETDESNLALKSFLSAVLNRNLTYVTVKSNEPVTETKKQKRMTFDVCAEFDDGEIAEIEMQAWKQDYDYRMRAEILVSRLLTNNAKRGKSWNAPMVYQISLINFHYEKSDNKEVRWYTMQDNKGKKLTDRLNIIFIDLEEIRKKLGSPVEKLTPVEKWGLFFCYVDHDDTIDYINNLASSEEGIMAAQKIVRRMSKANENWFTQNSIYKAEHDAQAIKLSALNKGLEEGRKQGIIEGRAEGIKQGIEQGVKQGIQQGIEQGRQQGLQEAVRRFHENGLSLEIISQSLGISLEETEKFINQ